MDVNFLIEFPDTVSVLVLLINSLKNIIKKQEIINVEI
jgi:hypothetical protein